MVIKYQINTDIVSGGAATFTWLLQQLEAPIRIINKGRIVNGQSLIGVISANIRTNDIITIVLDDPKDEKRLRTILDDYGKQLN